MRFAKLMLVPCLLIAFTVTAYANEAPTKEAPPKAETKPDAKPPVVEEEAPKTATIDKKAPAFTAKDANGVEHKLSDYADKLVVLEWVNYGCPYIKKHYDGGNMTSLEKKYRDKGVIWLQVCSADKGKEGYFDGEALTKKITEMGDDANFYLVDTDGTIGRTYQAKCTPHMFVIDKKGILRYDGAIDSIASADKEDVAKATNYVSDALDELIADKAVTTKETKPYGCGIKFAPKVEEAKDPSKKN